MKLNSALAIATSVLAAAVIAGTAVVVTTPPNPNPKPSMQASQAVGSSSGEEAKTALRAVVDASIAKLGSTGWVQVQVKTGKRVFFDPTYEGEYKVAAKGTPDGNPFVHGSMFEVIPFDLMDKLERTPEDLSVTVRGDTITVKNVDTAANGTAFTEYKIADGLIVSATIRDRVGAKNELKDVTQCHYGLDSVAKSDLIYANENQSFGHD
jgi:hypothetical protein